MKTKTFNFNGKRYFIRGRTDNEITTKMAEKKLELMQAAELEAHTCMTVEEWFWAYMEAYKGNIAPYTYKNYIGIYNNQIKAKIGSLPIDRVKPIQCQQILNGMSHLSASYIHKTYLLLRGMFFRAYENDLIQSMPVKGIVLPKGYTNERRALTDSERKAFLQATANSRNSSLFCRIIYYCGLRPSEVLRIRGGDVSGSVLHVRGTKTKAATRDVPVPAALVLPDIPPGELMFQTFTGNPIEKKRVREYWLAVKRDMHLAPDNDLTLYCLRHDYCTRLEEAGIPLNVASRLMGHSSVEITSKIYTHGSEVTLLSAEALINQYNQAVTASQNAPKSPDFRGNSQDPPDNEKGPESLKFQAVFGAPRAIRTRNLLIRRGYKKL